MPHRLRSLLASIAAPVPGLTDAELLARFAATRDEAAFEALVWRHGAMVRAVCRQILGPRPDVDDAFQATFLVLARKAGAVQNRAAVGGWLYRVAGRVATKLRARRARQEPTAEDLTMIPARPVQPPPAADVRAAIDEEILRLPEKYRLPVQLCYVAGQTTTDAARNLGWPKGTLLTRLAWARRRLQTRLAGRGLAPAVGVFTGLAAGALDPAVVRATARAAVSYAAGGACLAAILPAKTLSLSDGVIRAMFYGKLKIAAGVMMVATATGVGTVATGFGPQTAPQTKKAGPGNAPALKPPAADPLVTPAAPPPPAAGPPANQALELLKLQEVEARRQNIELVALAAQNRDLLKKMQLFVAETALAQQELALLRDELLKLKKQGLARTIEDTAPPPLPLTQPLPAPVVMEPPARIPPPAPAVPPLPMATARLPVPTPATGKTFTVTGPRGDWHRAISGYTTTLKFTEDRLTIVCVTTAPDGPKTFTIEADYSFNRDGVVFGYITGIDGVDGDETMVGMQALTELPFSFRFRTDDTTVTIKDVKGTATAEVPGQKMQMNLERIVLPGRYTDKPQPARPATAPPMMGEMAPRRTAPSVDRIAPSDLPYPTAPPRVTNEPINPGAPPVAPRTPRPKPPTAPKGPPATPVIPPMQVPDDNTD